MTESSTPILSVAFEADARACLMLGAHRSPVTMVRGRGSWLWDAEGRAYLDLSQGWAVNALGHSPPELVDALAHQARALLNPGPAHVNAPQLAAAHALARASGLDEVFLCSTGAEANEGAVKLARAWGRLHRRGAATIVTTLGSFHGRTLAMTAASGKPGWEQLFAPMTPGFRKVPYGDLAAARAALDDDVAGLLVEPIQGEGGVVVPPPGYLRGLRKLADAAGVLLMCDEVQTGMGRTGRLFAHQAEGIRPDVLTLGKGLGGGFPVAALLARGEVSCFAPGEQGGTYAGNPLAATAAATLLAALEAPGFLSDVERRGALLRSGLEALAADIGGTVRGQGLLLALVLPTPDAPTIVSRAFADGLLINAPRADVMRLTPALNIGDDDLREALQRLRRCVRDAAA